MVRAWPEYVFARSCLFFGVVKASTVTLHCISLYASIYVAMWVRVRVRQREEGCVEDVYSSWT